MAPGWVRANVVLALTGTRVPDEGTMHWFSDMSQVLGLYMEFRKCTVILNGMINECMALWP